LKQLEKLNKYNTQVNPREINLFYIEDKMRERIFTGRGEIQNKQYLKLNILEDEILTLLDTNPEMFSPNVIMHPLYQGSHFYQIFVTLWSGEIAYWLELKSFF
jgi:uncharacterized protein YllA (UPF0747 family)